MTDADTDLGRRLQRVRENLGLSQRQLARQSNVPSATISLIESGKVSPSVGSLKRILDGIKMPLGEFFSFDLPESKRFFFRADELVEIGKGAISYRQLVPDRTDAVLQIIHETYQPGADTGKIKLSHEGQEGGIVLSGQMEVTVGDDRRILKAGDAYYFDSKNPHRFRNVSDKVCEVVSACTPPSF